MLYDKRWDAKVEQKADLFSLAPLIAWLEQQPTEKPYCYLDHGKCLLAQYFKGLGLNTVEAYGSTIDIDGKEYRLPTPWQKIPLGYPRTFGGALKRARAFR